MEELDECYPTRLAWRHTTGVARYDEVRTKLRKAPTIEGFECMTELEFIPGKIAEVRIGCQQKRDMTPVEQARAMAILIRMAAGARDPMDGDTTIAVVQR